MPMSHQHPSGVQAGEEGGPPREHQGASAQSGPATGHCDGAHMNPPQSWDQPRSPYLASPRRTGRGWPRSQQVRDRLGLDATRPLRWQSAVASVLTPLAFRLRGWPWSSDHLPRHCRYQSGYPETEAEAYVSRYLQSILPLIKAENGSHITVRLGGERCEAKWFCVQILL